MALSDSGKYKDSSVLSLNSLSDVINMSKAFFSIFLERAGANDILQIYTRAYKIISS